MFFLILKVLQKIRNMILLCDVINLNKQDLTAPSEHRLLVRLKTDAEKEKSIEEKKFALVANFYCGHAYSTDLIGHIFSASEPRRKKVTLIEQIGIL